MTKCYKLEVHVIDLDGIGIESVVSAIEHARYPNRCVSPKVDRAHEYDVGEWEDDHPLNYRNADTAAYLAGLECRMTYRIDARGRAIRAEDL